MPFHPTRAAWFAGLFTAEVLAVVLVFQLLASVECRLTDIETACRALRGGALTAISLAALFALALWARPAVRRAFTDMVDRRRDTRLWAMLHGLGVTALFVPMLLFAPDMLNANFAWLFAVLACGGSVAALGGLFWMAAPGDWLTWLRGHAGLMAGVVAGAVILPLAAQVIAPIWYWDTLTEATFIAVAFLLWLTTEAPAVDPVTQVIGTDGFFVAVADSCSGVEGFALITGFLLFYAVLFRDTLRMGRFIAVVWPVALLLSWVLNVLRITALIAIGAYVSPELAVNGFHSFAGWLFFTLLAMAILVVVNRWRWIDRGVQARAGGPLAHDWAALRIVPFIVFMLSGVLVQAFWMAPTLGYPLQVAMMLAALWWARRGLPALMVVPDPVALGVGGIIGGVWIWMAGPADPAQAAAILALGQVGLAAWIACRLLGTILLIPLIEEMFFRGYVQVRLDTGTPLGRTGAIAISAALFGVLHGRWFEAGLAGVALSLVFLRRGRLGDAVTAHAVANALIAGVAAWRGDWSLI